MRGTWWLSSVGNYQGIATRANTATPLGCDRCLQQVISLYILHCEVSLTEEELKQATAYVAAQAKTLVNKKLQ